MNRNVHYRDNTVKKRKEISQNFEEKKTPKKVLHCPYRKVYFTSPETLIEELRTEKKYMFICFITNEGVEVKSFKGSSVWKALLEVPTGTIRVVRNSAL